MYKASTKPVTLSVPTPYEHAIGYTFTYKCITREPKCVYSRIRYTYGFIPSTSDVTRPAPTRDLLKQTPTSIRTHARAVSAPRPRHVACECKKNSRRAVDDFSHCTVGTRPPETPSESMMLARLGRVRQPPLPRAWIERWLQRTGVCPSERNKLRGTASRSRAAFSCNEPTGRLVELIKAGVTPLSDFSEASPAGFYSRSPAAHHWSPRRCGVPPNLTESSSQSRVQTTPSVNKWSAASRRSALV